MQADEYRVGQVQQATFLDSRMVKHDGNSSLSQRALNPRMGESPTVSTHDSSPSTRGDFREVKRRKLERAFRGSQFLLGTTRAASPTHDRTDHSSLLAGLKRKRKDSIGGGGRRGGGGGGNGETAQSEHNTSSPPLRHHDAPWEPIRGHDSALNRRVGEAEKHSDRTTYPYPPHTTHVPQADLEHLLESAPQVPRSYPLAAKTDDDPQFLSLEDPPECDLFCTHSHRYKEERSNGDLNATHRMAIHSPEREQEQEQEWRRERKQHGVLRQPGPISTRPSKESRSTPTVITAAVREHRVNYTISDDRTGNTAKEKRRLLAILMKDHRGGLRLRVGTNSDDKGIVVNTNASEGQQVHGPRYFEEDGTVRPMFADFTVPEQTAFNLDFSTLENGDVLQDIDFDKFLDQQTDDVFTFDSEMNVGNFGMDMKDGGTSTIDGTD